MKTRKVVRTEQGWAGHFCASSRCRFRRNTLLECGSRRVVVSTVGNYWPPPLPPDYENVAEEIGCDRYYETMAFSYDPPDRIIWQSAAHHEREANRQHDLAVRWFSRKLEAALGEDA